MFIFMSTLILLRFNVTILKWMSQAAVISLGLIGAGTNNARIAGMLRNLSSYYYKDASLLFCVMMLMKFSILEFSFYVVGIMSV